MKIPIALMSIAVALSVDARAQNLKPELVEPTKRLVEAFDLNLKAWTRERGTPIEGSSAGGVVIEFWRMNDRTVKVSLVLDPVTLWSLNGEPQNRPDGFERATTQGYCGSHVSFYRGRLGISVYAEANTNMFSMNEKENSALSCAEDAATSKLMACFVNVALNGDLQKGKPIPKDFFKSACVRELVFKRFFGDYVINQLMHQY